MNELKRKEEKYVKATIKRESGEDIRPFINRVAEIRADIDEDFYINFANGNILDTEKYKYVDNLAQDIERDYVDISVKTAVNMQSDGATVETVVNDDGLILEYKLLDKSEIFEENFQDEDMESEVEIEDNKEILIPIISLESLHLLTDVAIKDGNFPKIDVNEQRELAQKLEDAKASYEVLFEEKKRQTEVTKKRIEEMAHERGREIKEQIDLIVEQKREYTKIIDEYKIELANLEKGYTELKEKLDKGEFSKDIVDMINKSKVLEDKNIKSSELLEFIPVEELKHIYKLKWNVEAYQEYIDFVYTRNYPDLVKSSVDTLKTASVESKEEEKTMMLEMFPGSKIDENGNVDYDFERDDPELIGMRDYINTLETLVKNSENHPAFIEEEILSMMYEGKSSEEIKPLLDELMANVKNKVIIQSFDSDSERLENVNSEISDLTEKIEKLKELSLEQPLNEDMINIDNASIERLKVKSENLAREIEECDLVINKKDNKSRIYKLSESINKYNLFEIKNIKEKQIYIAKNGEKENDPQIAMFDQNIKFCKSTLESLKELRDGLLEDNYKAKKFMTVKHAETKKAKLISEKEIVDKSINELEVAKQEKIDNGEYIDTTVVNKRNKEIMDLEEELDFLGNLKLAISNHSVQGLQDSILNYNNPDYFNGKDLDDEEEVIDEDLSEVENTENEVFEENLPDMENTEEEVFAENILEEDFEEITEEKPAKRSLLERIKSSKFKKIAVTAILGLVSAAAVIVGVIGTNLKKTKDEIKDVGVKIENFVEDTKVPEKMENIADVQKEKIESEKVVEQPESIVDTSRIAKDIYNAAEGNFIPEENVYKERFDDKLIEDIIEMEANGKKAYVIIGENGVPIGATDQVNEVEQTGKIR